MEVTRDAAIVDALEPLPDAPRKQAGAEPRQNRAPTSQWTHLPQRTAQATLSPRPSHRGPTHSWSDMLTLGYWRGDGARSPSSPPSFFKGDVARLSPERLQRVAAYVALADYPYQLNMSRIERATKDLDPEQHGSWSLNVDLASKFAEGCGLTCVNGCISDGSGGMKAYVFVNDITREVTIVFGGTSSTSTGGGAYNIPRLVWGAPDHFYQWITNLQSVFGSQVPRNFKDAAALVGEAMKGLPKGYALSTCGHSKGGAEAAFAAAMNSTQDRQINAVCFSSAPLGPPLTNQLSTKFTNPEDLTKIALNGIDHFNVAGDPVPSLDGWVNAVHLGNTFTVPRSPLSGPPILRTIDYYVPGSGGILGHVDFYNQVTSYVNRRGTGGGSADEPT